MTHGRPLSRPPALGSSPSEGAAAAPGHCGDSRRNDYANPRSPLPLSRGWQLMLRDACTIIVELMNPSPPSRLQLADSQNDCCSRFASRRLSFPKQMTGASEDVTPEVCMGALCIEIVYCFAVSLSHFFSVSFFSASRY